MNLVEQVRSYVVRDIHAVGSFQLGWAERKALMRTLMGTPTADWSRADFLRLGDHLGELFATGRAAGRTQAGLTSAGTVWEALVCWYLNVAYAGTDAIAVRRTWVPPSVRAALTVFHGPAQVAADIDAMVLHVPGLSRVTSAGTRRAAVTQFQEVFETRFREAAIVIVACKTNWNDAIQTPMLWNLLYTQKHRGVPLTNGFAIGRGGWSLDALARFLYAFVTVPTQNHAGFRAGTAPVLRANTMTGGAYWGWPTRHNVCLSISEFFNYQAGRAGLPSAAVVGSGVVAEIASRAGDIDVDAFDLP